MSTERVRLRPGDSTILPKIIEGISPEVTLTEQSNGVLLTVTTKSGSKSALIPKGEQGIQGPQGIQGIQGIQGPAGDDYQLTEEDVEAIKAAYDDIKEAAEDAAEAAAGSAEDAAGYAETAAEKEALATAASEAASEYQQTTAGYVTNAQTYAGQAATSAEQAAISAENALASVGDAEAAVTAAETAQGKAEDAQTAAETAQGKAEDAQEAAETAQGKAEDAQEAAETAQEAAEAVLESIPADYSELSSDVSELSEDVDSLKSAIADKADVIVSSASGDIASFEDGADGMPVKALTVQIEPVQDLHGYDNPWPAGGGKNKFNQAVYSQDSVYSVGFSGYRYTDTITLKPNTQYTFKPDNTTAIDSGIYYVIRTKDGDDFSADDAYIYTCYNGNLSGNSVRNTITTGSTGKISFGLPSSSGWSENLAKIMAKNWQLEEGSTATEWSPYENICPITGHTGVTVTRTGRNLLDISHAVTGERFNANGTTSFGNNVRSEYIPVKPNTAYYFKNVRGLAIMAPVWWYDKDKTNLSYANVGGTDPSSGVLTSPANAAYVGVNFAPGYTDSVAVNYPSTETAYSPGSLASVTLQLGQTVYGGTLDPVEGVLRVTHTILEYDGSQDEGWLKTDGGYGYYWASAYPSTINKSIKPIDSLFPWNANSISTMSNLPDGQIAFGPTGEQLNIKSSAFATLEDFKAYLSEHPLQIVATLWGFAQQTIQLDPVTLTTLLGSNRIWADCGDVSVEYRADTKLYIELLTKPTEDDMKANTAITSGKFFMIGNRLFLATAAIASGATIIPGTNCTELSLAEALNNVNA